MPLYLLLFASLEARFVDLQDASVPDPVTIVVAMVPVVTTARRDGRTGASSAVLCRPSYGLASRWTFGAIPGRRR